jgi:hypothetical protein
LNHKDTLKVQALLERIAELTAKYEDKIADVRADFTLAVEEFQAEIKRLGEENENVKSENEALKKGTEDVVEKE